MPIWETNNHIFKYPWEDVSLASWRKYPCERRPDILAVDTVARQFNPNDHTLQSIRVSFAREPLPRLIAPMFGGGTGISIEHSFVDPVEKKMVLSTKNISFDNVMTIEEICTYTKHPENPDDWTQFKQEIKVTAFPYGFRSTLENFFMQKLTQNASKGRAIMEETILRIRNETDVLKRAAEETFDDLRQRIPHLDDELLLDK